MSPDRLAAAALLGCRPDASAQEVKAAYRRALHRDRPDLDAVDGEWTVRLQRARDLLLTAARPDRRRRARRPEVPADFLPLRRSVWGLTEEPAPSVEVRL